MKIVKEKSKFNPVTITIESEDELKILLSALGVSDANLKEVWEEEGLIGKFNENVAFDMYKDIKDLVKDL